MKSMILAFTLTAFAGLCAAQGTLPACAQTCVVKFTSGSSIGGCQSQDAKCICSAPSFLGDIACCLAASCNTDDQKAATDYAKNFCELSGVTNLPTAVVCSSTATSNTAAATGSGSSSNTASNTGSTTGAPTVAATTSAPATSSTPNAAAQNAAGVGAGFGMLALAALL